MTPERLRELADEAASEHDRDLRQARFDDADEESDPEESVKRPPAATRIEIEE